MNINKYSDDIVIFITIIKILIIDLV